MAAKDLKSILIVLLVTVCLSCPALAQDSLNVLQIGELVFSWGEAENVVIVDELAYLIDVSASLRIVDISDPLNPIEIGYFDPPGGGYDIVVSGDLAFFTYSKKLSILDVSYPTWPVELSLVTFPRYAVSLAKTGDYVYVSTQMYGLQIVNVSDPNNPVIENVLDNIFAEEIKIQGNYAYVCGPNTLFILDITDPLTPTQVGTFNAHDAVYGVALQGDLAYIEDEDGLCIADIADPANTFEVGYLGVYDNVRDVAVSGNYAYLANEDEGLRVIDVSDPSNPIEVGSCSTPDRAFAVALSGNDAYVAAETAGMRVIDVEVPSNPVEIAFISKQALVVSVEVSGDFAFIADEYGSIRVVDVSSPSLPTEVSSYPMGGMDVEDLALEGGYVFVAAYFDGMHIIDVSDPFNPIELGYCLTHSPAAAVDVVGNYAYVAGLGAGFYVIDASDPASPVLVGTYDTFGNAEDIVVQGDYAYIADDAGLCIVDITDPYNPQGVGYERIYSDAFGLDVEGDYAYLANGFMGLRSINVSHPEYPLEVGYHSSIGTRQVDVEGDFAYMVCQNYGFAVDNISDPANPYTVGYHPSKWWSNDVFVYGDYVYVTDGHYLFIYDFLEPTTGPDLEVQLIPAITPVTIPASGGTFDFSLSITNTTDETQTFEAWTQIVDPGVSLEITMGPVELTLQPNSTVSCNRTQRVSANTLPGLYFYRACVGDFPNDIWHSDSFTFEKLVSGSGDLVDDNLNYGEPFTTTQPDLHIEAPANFILHSARPNPFNPTTQLSFDLPKPGRVEVVVYDIFGRQVAELLNDWRNPGSYQVNFNAEGLSSGIYFTQMKSGGYLVCQKIIYLK